ncbi:MAG: HAD family hydrolase [Betaproteobacteria bacterium HGW-Betaproteobacteria-18]|nr:MAG: HAD family hydrolase [Betaproteobacteria bacterium HGW-Betaproteobacteria-18]
MQPLSAWSLTDRRHLIGVFTDIDDTLTTDGAITPEALQALACLKAAGLHVIPITGRPIGWCEPFASGDASHAIQPWPVDALVAENGAVAFAWNKHKKLSKIYQQSEATRTHNFAQMQQVAARVLRDLPEARLSQDSPGRETDIAIDHSEFSHLPPEKIARVVRIMQSAGMQATVSSIHINGWFGSHNKLEGARWIVRELLGRDLDTELNQWVYVGDSSNDQIMFQHFKHSIGVANIRRFEAELNHRPRFITPSERGAGFAEVARAILGAQISPRIESINDTTLNHSSCPPRPSTRPC